MSKQLTVTISDAQKQALTEAATQLGKKQSDIIREALAEYFAKNDLNFPDDAQPHGYRKSYRDFEDAE